MYVPHVKKIKRIFLEPESTVRPGGSTKIFPERAKGETKRHNNGLQHSYPSRALTCPARFWYSISIQIATMKDQ